jgi:VWFA-related protein
MRCIATVVALIAASVLAGAQEYSVEVRLVEVEVRVTGGDGRPVTALTRADFALTEDGVAHDVSTVQYVPEPRAPIRRSASTDTADAESDLDEALPAPPPTWITVLTEIGPTEVPRVLEALRAFVLTGLRPGFHVSLAGQPFTEDRATLLDTVARLARRSTGKDDHGLVDLQHQLADDAAREREMSNSFRRQEEGAVPLAGFTSRPERVETTAAFAQPYITEGRVDRQLPVYGDVALNHYFDLIERLASRPGKKVVVLFRPGLRLETDNVGLLHDLASFAVRRRVSFYTADSRGLLAMPPVDDTPVPFNIDRRRRRGEPDLIGQRETVQLARAGLEDLARETGGRAVAPTNRLAQVFEQVARDAAGYYVLGYYPIDLRAAGRFRTVKVVVSRPGVKVQQTTRGYYEPRPTSLFQGDDRGLALRRAMQGAAPPSDLPVAASIAYFATRDGLPVFVLSAGVPASQLEAEQVKGSRRLAATAMVRVADADHARVPMYFERQLEAPLPDADWLRAQKDRTAFVAMSDSVALVPGDYEWRVVFRDERSGRMGGLDGRVTLADYRAASSVSSLLLTREISQVPASDTTDEGRQPLDVGDVRYAPQPSLVFRRGETVHFLYALYNASSAQLDEAAKGLRVALFRNGAPVHHIEASGRPVIDRAAAAAQFSGFLSTAALEPGAYVIRAILPELGRPASYVEQRFVLIAGDPS